MSADDSSHRGRLSTGVDGLDEVLGGGLLQGRCYVVRGQPGAGKTLLGHHFLTAGEGDALFVNLGEFEDDVRRDAAAFGFDLEDVSFLDFTPSAAFFTEEQSYDIFPTDEVEQSPVTGEIAETVESIGPRRVFVDPMTQLRYLSRDDHQFRKQVLSFLQFLKEAGCTVLFTSQDTAATPDDDLQFMSDGVVHLDYARDGRTVEVTKFRGSTFESGRHAVRIDESGMTVYPRLVPGDHDAAFDSERVGTGVTELDDLLGGGVERGTVTVLSGPSGVGKTTTGTQFARQAASRGERAVVYLFEERAATYRHRSEAIGIPVGDLIDEGTLVLEEVSGLDVSPQEFAARVRHQVDVRGAEVVMVDGIEGYKLALSGEDADLRSHLHALATYLKNVGATGIFVSEVQNVTGAFRVTEDEISYLADNVVFLRYLEFEGELRKAVGVLKKRAGPFEQTLREFEITGEGIRVGEPLTGLRGILEGTPEWTGTGPDAPE